MRLPFVPIDISQSCVGLSSTLSCDFETLPWAFCLMEKVSVATRLPFTITENVPSSTTFAGGAGGAFGLPALSGRQASRQAATINEPRVPSIVILKRDFFNSDLHRRAVGRADQTGSNPFGDFMCDTRNRLSSGVETMLRLFICRTPVGV